MPDVAEVTSIGLANVWSTFVMPVSLSSEVKSTQTLGLPKPGEDRKTPPAVPRTISPDEARSVRVDRATGRHVVDHALAAGHTVVAVARRPDAIKTEHAALTIARGDVLDPLSIRAAIAGVDAVISAFGPANNKKPGTLIS